VTDLAYADPETLIASWVTETLSTKTWADPRLPGNWNFTAPITHIQRGQGLGQAPLSLDDVTLDFDTYAADADHARRTASRIWSAVTLRLPLVTFDNGIFVKGAWCLSPPSWAPDPAVYRRTAAYRIVLHGFVTT
jgi:hypothetical protein